MKSWKTIVRIGWLPVLAAAGYVGWTMYSRQAENRRQQQEADAKEATELRKTIRDAGGTELKILGFYSSPSVTAPGQKALLCYSVANAESVRIEPAGPPITPSLSRCVEVSPSKTTTYRLIAESGRDRKVDAEANVTVR